MTVSFIHPDLFQEYRVIPVKFDESYEAAHQILFKPHKVSDPCPEKPNMRTLFLANVPMWASLESIKHLFSCNGPIDKLYFQQSPSSGPPPCQFSSNPFDDTTESRLGNGFKYCYIVYEKSSSIKQAMGKMDVSKVKVLSGDSHRIEMGLNKWRQEYNDSITLSVESLGQIIEEAVARVDAQKAEEKQKAEQEADEADEEGWVTVSRHTSRKPVGRLADKAQKKVKAKEALRRKRKELENFYRYQMKEKKLNKLNELKEKFEADKQKQLKMKQKRKFKPS